MINRRILASLMILGIVGALAAGSTMALLNDTETSDTNTFQAGPVDVEMEIPPGQPLPRMEDVKPGDVAEEEVDVEVEGNPAFVEMRLNETEFNHENGCTEPEREAEGGDCGTEGELRENTHLTVWHDENGNQEVDNNEEVILENPSGNASKLREGMMIDADPSTEEIDPVTDSKTIMFRWEIPRELGNEAQTDTFSYNLQVKAEQARHNGPENAAEWYHVTGENAGEPVNNTNDTENNDAEESNSDDTEQENDSETEDESSDSAEGFSDSEESDSNDIEIGAAQTEETDDSESNAPNNQQPEEGQESSNDTTEYTGQEENNSSTGQFSAGATQAAGLLLILFITASAIYTKRL